MIPVATCWCVHCQQYTLACTCLVILHAGFAPLTHVKGGREGGGGAKDKTTESMLVTAGAEEESLDSEMTNSILSVFSCLQKQSWIKKRVPYLAQKPQIESLISLGAGIIDKYRQMMLLSCKSSSFSKSFCLVFKCTVTVTAINRS